MSRDEPVGGHAFRLEIEGREVVPLLAVHGIGLRVDAYRFGEGGELGFEHVRVGGVRWDDLQLVYAASCCAVLGGWRDAFVRDPLGPDVVRSGAVTMFDLAGDVVRRFAFVRAWPLVWAGPAFDARTSSLAVETLVLAHEGLRITTGEA